MVETVTAAVYIVATLLVARSAAGHALRAEPVTSDDLLAVGGVALLWPVALVAVGVGWLAVALRRWERRLCD
jgi:hypothetical protein